MLDESISKEIYDQKEKTLNNEIVQLKKDLDELNKQKNQNSEITLERIKNVFLYPIKAKKQFKKENDTEKEKTVKTLLWNAQFKNKKITNFSFKEPYLTISKIKNKSDFSSWRDTRVRCPSYIGIIRVF